jgi:alanyl-tRNA synthetase
MEDKVAKKILKEKASKEPEKFYPVEFLESLGFKRQKCKKCGTYFWSKEEREVCGDVACIGKYEFIGQEMPEKLDFIAVWKKFKKVMEKLGYTPIKPYPVVARWRDDLDFVIASIADFQPWVVEGISKPPANPLIVPQFCLRFNDIDNVGITGRHYTGFVMIGQHAFEKPENYDKNKYLEDIYTWLTKGFGLKDKDIIFHEDAWAGGGNAGPSIEFFSKGLELGNQVYMQYDIKGNEFRKLDLMVLDMGTGQERYAWFSHGTTTSYEPNFPTVLPYLKKYLSLNKEEEEIYNKFLPYSGLLNVDEANVKEEWKKIAKILEVDENTLKEIVMKKAAIYSIAEHTRSLLMAFNDGAVPSNVGGGYNLRLLARRIFSFIRKYDLDLDLAKIFELHYDYLKEQYDLENWKIAIDIMEEEKKKFEESIKKAKNILLKELKKKKELTKEDLIKMYESHGVTPEIIEEVISQGNLNVKVEVPENFYVLIEEIRNKQKRKKKKETLVINKELPETKALYWY